MKIKKIFISLAVLLFLISSQLFCGIRDDVEIRKELAKVDLDRKLYLGIDLGFGASKQMATSFENGENTLKLSYQIGVSLTYFLNRVFAVNLEVGNHLLSCKDEDTKSSDYVDYTLNYIFISVSPLFKFKTFFFSFGFYFGFIAKTVFSASSLSFNEYKYYNSPDIGLKIGLGYIFRVSRKMEMSIGVQTKIQLQNFRILEQYGGQIFAAYLQTGLLFEM